MNYLVNGMSESMKRDPNMKAIPYPLSESEFINLIHNGDFKSVIGHEQLADCLTKLTGVQIKYNRKNIQLNYDDTLLLVSLNGRLPERPTYVEYKGRLKRINPIQGTYNFLSFYFLKNKEKFSNLIFLQTRFRNL